MPGISLLKFVQLSVLPRNAVERPEPGHTQVPQQKVPLYAEADLLAENLGEGTGLQVVVERRVVGRLVHSKMCLDPVGRVERFCVFQSIVFCLVLFGCWGDTGPDRLRSLPFWHYCATCHKKEWPEDRRIVTSHRHIAWSHRTVPSAQQLSCSCQVGHRHIALSFK